MTKKRTAVITGITGQDGAYLAQLLLSKGYKVYGTYRRLSTPNFWRLQSLGIHDKVEIIPLELSDSSSIISALKRSNPDEFYNLAAQSFVGSSFENPMNTSNVSGLGVVRILEVIRQYHSNVRFYQASTSEMYGDGREGKLNENSRFEPSSPYAAAKLYAHWITINYREAYDLFACNGILFNHESERRGKTFVTRKISVAVAKITLDLQDTLYIGNLDAKRDWGYAPEYCEGMWRMLQADKPDDYVLATGETHSVREFVEESFEVLGEEIEWEGKGVKEKGILKSSGNVVVEIDACYFRPTEVEYLLGDPTKVKKELGWVPKVTFKNLVSIMVNADYQKQKVRNEKK